MTVADYSQYYQDAGQKYGIDPALLMAQGQQESSGDPTKVSDAGAIGIAQLMPATAKSLGVDPTDPKQAIDGQARLMASNIKQYGDIPTALMAYHGGSNTDNWGPKTKAYPGQVMKNYKGTQMADNSDDIFTEAQKGLDAQKTAPPQSSAPQPSGDIFDEAQKAIDTKTSTQTAEAKSNPSLSDQYSSDVRTAGKRILNDLVQNKGRIDPLDVGGAIGSGVSSAIGQTANRLTPDVVKNALTSTWNGIQGGPQSVANAIDSTGAGQSTGNAFMGASNATSNALTSAAQTFPNVARHLGDAADIAGGVASVEGVGAAGKLGVDAVSAGKNLLVKDSDALAKNALLKNAADSNSLLPQNIDTTQIVPGSKPTLAQATGDANIASIEKQLKKTPENNAAFAAQESENETARQQYFQTNAAGTPQDINTLKTQRESLTAPLYGQAKIQPLNTAPIQPVLDNFDKAIQEVGSDTDAGKALLKIKGKIQSALPTTKTASTGLLDADGNPITKELPQANPTQSPLVQVFREERDKAADNAVGEDAYANAIKTHVQPLIRQLGSALESQSKPFADAQNIYRTMSPEINSKQWLQNLDLKDKYGNLSLSKVDNAYENAVSLRNSAGLNPAKDLSDTQLQTLKNIRDDLQSRDATIKLGNGVKTPNALQQSPGLVKKVIHEGIGAGVGAAVAALTGGNPWIGVFAGGTTVRGLESAAAKKSLQTGNSLSNFTLNPEQYKNYLMTGVRP